MLALGIIVAVVVLVVIIRRVACVYWMFRAVLGSVCRKRIKTAKH
jgi:hypothetical protein